MKQAVNGSESNYHLFIAGETSIIYNNIIILKTARRSAFTLIYAACGNQFIMPRDKAGFSRCFLKN